MRTLAHRAFKLPLTRKQASKFVPIHSAQFEQPSAQPFLGATLLSEQERILVDAALGLATVDLETTIPPIFERHRSEAQDILKKVAEIYGDVSKMPYFETSLLRYEQYFSIARELEHGARVLEIGSAPGHVSIGLSLLGFRLNCLNLNAIYRSQYPSEEWIARLNVVEHDFEKAPLPFDDHSFDVVFFTEVLEHIAIKPVVEVLRDIRRVCKPSGTLILSTPNVNNISNVAVLLHGANVFWRPEIFYGSLDRHNREFTPAEVSEAVSAAAFTITQRYGFNCHSNWRAGGADFAYRVIAEIGDNHPLLRNTIMVVAKA